MIKIFEGEYHPSVCMCACNYYFVFVFVSFYNVDKYHNMRIEEKEEEEKICLFVFSKVKDDQHLVMCLAVMA